MKNQTPKKTPATKKKDAKRDRKKKDAKRDRKKKDANKIVGGPLLPKTAAPTPKPPAKPATPKPATPKPVTPTPTPMPVTPKPKTKPQTACESVCCCEPVYTGPVKNTSEANRTAAIVLGAYFTIVVIFMGVAAWIGFGGM